MKFDPETETQNILFIRRMYRIDWVILTAAQIASGRQDSGFHFVEELAPQSRKQWRS